MLHWCNCAMKAIPCAPKTKLVSHLSGMTTSIFTVPEGGARGELRPLRASHEVGDQEAKYWKTT